MIPAYRRQKTASFAAAGEEIAGFRLEVFAELLKNLLQPATANGVVASFNRQRELDHHAHSLPP
jgi:hypothetical protein